MLVRTLNVVLQFGVGVEGRTPDVFGNVDVVVVTDVDVTGLDVVDEGIECEDVSGLVDDSGSWVVSAAKDDVSGFDDVLDDVSTTEDVSARDVDSGFGDVWGGVVG